MKTVKRRSQFELPRKRIKYNKFATVDPFTCVMYDLKGNCTLIDIEDLEDVSQFYWYKHPTTGYWISNSNYTEIKLHRFITDCPKHLIVDHIHHNLDDHRKSELSVCNYSLNNSNREYSDLKNIYVTKSGKFEVVISVYGKLQRLGRYKTLEEAVLVRNTKREELQYAKC